MFDNNSDLATNFMKKSNFKVVEKQSNRPKSKRPGLSKPRNNYTLNCEKRMGQFKIEFDNFF